MRPWEPEQRDCSCPVEDGMIYHQKGSCTDPIVIRLGLYAGPLPGGEGE